MSQVCHARGPDEWAPRPWPANTDETQTRPERGLLIRRFEAAPHWFGRLRPGANVVAYGRVMVSRGGRLGAVFGRRNGNRD